MHREDLFVALKLTLVHVVALGGRGERVCYLLHLVGCFFFWRIEIHIPSSNLVVEID